jgi:transposase
MSKAQAARTFSVSLSSVKRYLNKAKRGESLELRRRAQDLLRSSTRKPQSSLVAISRNVLTSPFRSAATT